MLETSSTDVSGAIADDLSQRNLYFSRALATLIAAAICWACLRPLLLPVPWILFVEDDFFYYIKVAQNLAQGAGSSFNGIVPTNGYHPLWLLLLAGLSAVSTAPRVIFAFIVGVSLLATLATFLLSRKILRLGQLSPLFSTALAGCVTAYSLPILLRGMEVTLTLPLMLLFILMAQEEDRWTAGWKSGLTLGLVTSAMILSRLDSLLLAGLVFALLVSVRSQRSSPRLSTLGGVALGLVPVGLYVLSNVVFFHTLMPVSGMAKQLKTNYRFSAPALRSAFDRPFREQLILLILPVAMVTFPFVLRRFTRVQQVVFGSVLIFPFLYIGVLSLRSDWRLWEWYLYAFRPALCVSLLILCSWSPLRRVLQGHVAMALLVVFVLVQVASFRWTYEGRVSLLDAAVDIEHFALAHPGIFAMGDRSGITAYLLPYPLIQTEGLVMDRNFLRRIQSREPLLDALDAYKVRYYIANSILPAAGCMHVMEPAQAGPASPHMEADLCMPPVVSFAHAGYYTYIYDLHPDSESKPGPMAVR
jgi:hypothetical protein